MVSRLATLKLTATESNTLIDSFAAETGGEWSYPFQNNPGDYEIRGSLSISLRDAKAHYELSTLRYGPVDIVLKIDLLRIKIDWHKKLGIPKQACIVIRDPCGDVIAEHCWDFDLGVTNIDLMRNITFHLTPSVEFIALAFRDHDAGEKYFRLVGNVGLFDSLYELLLGEFLKGAIRDVEDIVTNFLEQLFGDGEGAKVLIGLIKRLFSIVNAVADFVDRQIATLFLPIDEILQRILPSKEIEIVLQKEAIPKDLTLIRQDANGQAVSVFLKTTPTIVQTLNGLAMEILE